VDGWATASACFCIEACWAVTAPAVLDGMSRAEAARIGGMDRQILRDWMPRFNASGPEGLMKDDWARKGQSWGPLV
jgi:hypothetical protein